MKKLLSGLVIGVLAFGGFLLVGNQVEVAQDLEPSIFHLDGFNSVEVAQDLEPSIFHLDGFNSVEVAQDLEPSIFQLGVSNEVV